MTNSSNNSDGVGVSYEEDTLNNDVTMTTTSMTTTFGSNATDDSEDMTTVNLDEFVQEVNEEEDDTRDICNSSQINSSMDKEGELKERKAEEENINDNNNKDERSTSSSLSTITISTTANDDAAIICSSAVLLSSSEKKKMEEGIISSSTNQSHHHHHPSSNKLLSSSASSSSGDDILVTTNTNSNNNNSNNSATTTSTSSTSSTTIPLSTLPIDAIHSISTYCTINDWLTLCITSKLYYYNIGPIIISKCYGHVYRCALEVAYCWARGEHADARELAALYTSSGVPIYPAPHGHSYRTLAWRMGLELETMSVVPTTTGDGIGGRVEERGEVHQGGIVVEGNEGGGRIDALSSSTTNNNKTTTTDAFYLERYRENVNDANNERRNAGFARRGGGDELAPPVAAAAAVGENHNVVVNNNNNNNNNQHVGDGHRRGDRAGRMVTFSSRNHTRSLTYVEEKAVFWKRNMGIEVTDDRHSFSSPFPLRDAPQARFPRRLLARGPPPPPLPPLEAPMAAAQARGAADRNVPVPIDGNERHPDEIDDDNDLQNILHILDPRTRRSRSYTNPTNNGVEEVADITSTRRNSEDLNNIPHPLLQEEEVTLETPKLTIRVHRHLVDQHLFGTPSVDDENGTMNTGKMSMSADFFHPRLRTSNAANFDGGYSWDDNTAWRRTAAGMESFNNDDAPPQAEDNIGEETARDGAAVDNNYRAAAVRSLFSWTMANTDRHQRRNSLPARTGSRGARLPLSMMFNPTYGASASLLSQSNNYSPASDVHLELYSSTSANLKSDNEMDDPATTSEAIHEMRSRCARYQKRFDSILKTNFDTYPFQECLLDFWDEVFPSTAGIHFYNQQSPVPRMSQLHTFLTTPCPKAIGTIQCEIERVKITGKDSKGAKRVKGRFFPSYEYRLFIKDTRNDHPFQSRHCPRKDSVLLVATNKRRGSKSSGLDFATPSGLTSPSSNGGGGGASKRGMTNYYMCLPQKVDVDSHYKSSNRNNTNVTISPDESSGMALSPLAMQTKQSIVVGRLQSNFIGTEFQIFVPTGIQSMGVVSLEDNQIFPGSFTTDADDGVVEGDLRVHPIDVGSVDATNSTPCRKSRKGGDIVRLALRASSSISGRGSSRSNIIASVVGGDPAVNHSDVSRRKFFYSKRMRAIANSSFETSSTYPSEQLCTNLDPLSLSRLDSSTSTRIVEEENGAITYTANLLGNRPRIMDVCIPKLMVTEDGTVCDEWKREQESVINSGSNVNNSAMLNRFKYILNSMSLLEENDNVNGQIRPINNPGLMLLQNRPPWWNIELGAFVLNFGGRVKVASVKNFQLCERDVQDHIMQFGRIEGRHSFTMDFQYPLTPMQAFAIAISSLQSKISFG